jgi:hypothetical protein
MTVLSYSCALLLNFVEEVTGILDRQQRLSFLSQLCTSSSRKRRAYALEQTGAPSLKL